MKEVDVLGQKMRIPDFPEDIIREKKEASQTQGNRKRDELGRPKQKELPHED